MLCKLGYPRGVAVAQDLLTGREGGRLQQAATAFTGALDAGEGLPEAISVFCQSMADNATP